MLQQNWRTVIKLINDQSFMNKVTLGYLKDIKVVEPFGGPRPFHEISEEAFIKIVEKGGTTWAK